MLEALLGGVPHRIAVVGFDSAPKLVQPFTDDVDTAKDAILSLQPGCTRQSHIENCAGPHPVHDASLGDNGAAILDSISLSVDLLRTQPISYRRVILLISETVDRGSKITLEEAVRAVSDTNTSIYSIGFSTAKSEAAHYAHQQLPTGPGTPSSNLANHTPYPPSGCMGKISETDLTNDPDQDLNRFSRLYDCAGQLMPPLLLARVAAIAAADGLKRNVPETVAKLTGGEYFKLTNAKSLERSLSVITNHLPNRYMLSFQPASPEAGLHHLSLQLRDRPGLVVQARSTYWFDDVGAAAK
jgi:VWFA-related protein